DDSHLRFFTDELDSVAHSYYFNINPAFSGPIIKDRLWFYFNTELIANKTNYGPDPSGLNLTGPPAPKSDVDARSSLKLTWQMSARNKLSSYSSLQRDFSKYGEDPYSYERDAQSATNALRNFHGLIFESLLTDNLLLRSQVGWQEQWNEV